MKNMFGKSYDGNFRGGRGIRFPAKRPILQIRFLDIYDTISKKYMGEENKDSIKICRFYCRGTDNTKKYIPLSSQ